LLNVVLHEQFTEHVPERIPSSGKARARSKPAGRP
jgi:hypothetical protein